ncbi:permease [Skermanella stibiiresistens SB22]|uniref:Permease n=1 Tax=Skermanella stibiiresistens SB22 TaxID=1385369 RepID=W9GYM3_9PROT|nr:SLC13 family permease [Skermanella stibiiresistens]EWY36578.1 permease [Skermanella stibiiresistens SB22]
MSFGQIAAFSIVLGMVALLVWDRIRYDVVALGALLAAIVCGIVPTDKAFSGFSDDIVIIVASALVVSAAVGKSGVVELMLSPFVSRMKTTNSQIAILVSMVTVLSAFMKNIGALAIFMPIAFQISKRTGKPASRLLMPLSFGSLLGGVATLVGTSPNIIVSRMREDIVGEPFRMFDFAPVGAGLAVAGVVFLMFGWRLLPRKRGAGANGDQMFSIEDYTTEARLTSGSPLVGKTVYDLETMAEADITVVGIIRERYRRYVPSGNWTLFADDILVLEGDADALEKIVKDAKLELVGMKQDQKIAVARRGETGMVEAVITQGSQMIGRSAEQLSLRERFGVNLVAVSRRGRQFSQRLRRVRFQQGDLLVLQGGKDAMPETLAALGCLPLAERNLQLGRRRHVFLPISVLAIAMILVALQFVTVTIAFFGAAVILLASRVLTPQEAYEAIDWPILILLGALIPVSDALRTTGGTDLIAGWLSGAAVLLPPVGALGLILLVAMAVTPFLNNAATVLVMAPIGAGLAQRLGLNPDPFLMAVAVGAACDFLTPIGHQCNTLVMGPGGYRFGDYWRLGLPLSLIVVVLGTFLISVTWPM